MVASGDRTQLIQMELGQHRIFLHKLTLGTLIVVCLKSKDPQLYTPHIRSTVVILANCLPLRPSPSPSPEQFRSDNACRSSPSPFLPSALAVFSIIVGLKGV